MDYLPIAMPQSESELAVMVSMLDAHGIQHYVHNQGFGGLYPGLQIGMYNDRRIMVLAEQAAEAHELLAVLLPDAAAPQAQEKMALKDKLRVVAETFLFGWSFPRKRRNLKNDEGEI